MDRNLNNQEIIVNMPGNIVAQIDAQVDNGFTDREEFVRAAARHYLEYLRNMNDTLGSSIA
jgi:metal-responsive CopG/Arc/MetJ family transcriptional regulator